MTDERNYAVQTIDGCKIVRGPVPVSDVARISADLPKDARMDLDLAAKIGATMVLGAPADLDRLRARDLPLAGRRLAQVDAARAAGAPEPVVRWLADGERGLSSDALCKRLHGVPADAGDDHPHDPDDLRRCLLLLEAAGGRERLPAMSAASPAWAALVDAWPELEASFAAERGGTAAPRTWTLMRSVLDPLG